MNNDKTPEARPDYLEIVADPMLSPRPWLAHLHMTDGKVLRAWQHGHKSKKALLAALDGNPHLDGVPRV